jgi:diguanylate cyclase (GGDEF)-like protein
VRVQVRTNGRATPVLATRSAARRRISVALGVLLLAVVSVALFSINRLHAATDSAQKSGAISDLYQDARYYAAREDAQLMTYQVDRTRTARHAHDTAAAALDQTLNTIIETPTISSQDRAATRSILDLHATYQQLTARCFQLLSTNHAQQATHIEAGQITPLLQRMTTLLGGLEEHHHLSTVSQLRSAQRDGTMLEVGTPIALGLTLLLLAAFVLVTRGYRRTLERQALHDVLTGLPNRLLFADRVTKALLDARRTGAQPAVMLLDLDRFKDVNDTLGHHYGDQLLIELANRLRATLRPVDTVARLGGDEFAVLVTDGGRTLATQVAERILHTLDRPFTLAGITVGIEASIGIATADRATRDHDVAVKPNDDARMPDLLQQADGAMYEAKTDRCGIRHYVPGGCNSTPAHLTLLGELRQAFDRDELVLHYQPQVALDTGDLLGVEALVRWQHPTRGLLGPDEFIGLAEGTTLIHRLTAIVLDKALALCHDWLDQGIRLPVAVNVSARTLLDRAFPTRVAEHLALAGVPANMLCLELTESTIMSDPEGSLAVLNQLHDMGVRLSVDDFGTGYSSMAYLKILPVDELKVDRSFVMDMTSDTVLVQSAVDLGHNLGLTVVAEGVEDDATLTALKAVGADIVQGYYLGRPMDADLLCQWITAHDHQPAVTRHRAPSPAVTVNTHRPPPVV